MKTAYTKSDRVTGWAVFGIIAVAFALFLIGTGCSLAENEKIARDNPKFAPTTQAVEKGLEVIDNAAAATKAAAGTVEQAAHAADSVGIPYAKLVEILAGVVVGVTTIYTGHRMGTSTLSRGAKELTGSANGST